MGKISKFLKNKKLSELEFLCKKHLIDSLLSHYNNYLEYVDSGLDFIDFKLEGFYFTAFCNRLKGTVTDIKSNKLFLNVFVHNEDDGRKIYDLLSKKEIIKINRLVELKNELLKIKVLNKQL